MIETIRQVQEFLKNPAVQYALDTQGLRVDHAAIAEMIEHMEREVEIPR